MTLLNIHLLGDFSVTDGRGSVVSIPDGRTQALIVYLALKIGRTPSLSEAAWMLRDESAPADPLELVRQLRHTLRGMPEALIEDGDSLRFDPRLVEVDVRRFDDLLGAPSINSVRKAADCYRGNLLEGYQSGFVAFDAWIAEKRLTFWRAAMTVFGNLLTTQIRAGWWEEAVETAGRLLALDPSQEVVHRTLMRLQLEQGRPDAALRRYQECADVLRREYGREPEAETERLRAEIVRELERTPAPRAVLRARPDRPVLVLVVEDDMVSSALIEGYLVEAGYQVVAVADGGDALIELGRREFDILVLDINVPTLSGLKVFEIMLQKGMSTPALFITGNAGTDVEMQSLEMGAAGFLRKPVRKEVLLPKIRGILQRGHRQSGQNGG